MIEPNDTMSMKMAIGKEANLQRTFNIKNFSLSYNTLSVNCEHDWKVSAIVHKQLSKRVTPSTVDDLGLCLIFRPYSGEKLLSTKCI